MLGGKSQIPRLAGAPMQLPENVTHSMLSLSLYYKMQQFAIQCLEPQTWGTQVPLQDDNTNAQVILCA